jgi:hypothetical protein
MTLNSEMIKEIIYVERIHQWYLKNKNIQNMLRHKWYMV